MTKLRAITRTKFELTYPVQIETIEQAVNGPYDKTETFLELPVAKRRRDELLKSELPHIAKNHHQIVLREVATTILAEGDLEYERKLSPAPRPKKKD